MWSSLNDSPMTLVSSWLTSARNSKGNTGGAEWEWGGKYRQFLANKSPYLRNGARYDHSHKWPTNRKSHTRFRLVPQSQTLDDLERPKRTLLDCCRNDAFFEPTAQIWMKIDPRYQRQKRRPMTLVSGNVRFIGIFAGVSLAWASNESGVVDDGNILRFEWLLLRKLQR